ncbi:MAG: hypothetical protein WCH61_03625 [bacterium]
MASTVDWGKVVLAILDRLLLTQAELAARCKVAQQTVSGWKTGARMPGRYAQRQLVQLAREVELPEPNIPCPGTAAPVLGIAEQSPAKPTTGKSADTAQKAEWLRLLETLPEAERQELLDYARFKANRKRGTAARSQ